MTDNDSAFEEIWNQLLRAPRQGPYFLSRIQIDGLRGMHDFTVDFTYPVTVLAGENGCGKSTVLFAAACAQFPPEQNDPARQVSSGELTKVELPLWIDQNDHQSHQRKSSATRHRLHPQSLFPSYESGIAGFPDSLGEGTLRYLTWSQNETIFSQWHRTHGNWYPTATAESGSESSWPERICYLRTLRDTANWTSPLTSSRDTHSMAVASSEALSVDQIQFASAILPHFQYNQVMELITPNRNVLYAYRQNNSQYSEWQMAGGERVALRLGLEVSQLRNALVLVDEIETGLHPRAQQRLMRALQILALRRNLQIIVTTHSPVVLACVPPPGRKFFERHARGTVQTIDAYPDVIQDVLYGSPYPRKLRVLCEDDVAEGILEGVIDYLALEHGWPRRATDVLRNTGASEFPTHASAFAKCEMLHNFIFVLDGDQRERRVHEKIMKVAERYNVHNLPVLFLAGDSPEEWIWSRLAADPGLYASAVATTEEFLIQMIQDAQSKYLNANDKPSKIHKAMLEEVAREVSRSVPALCRVVARKDVEQRNSDLRTIADELLVAFENWRQR